MARAFVSYEFENIGAGAGDTFIVPITIIFAGTDLPVEIKIDRQRVDVTLAFTDSLGTMQTKIVDAVVARAAALSYTISRNGILLMTMGKGS